MTHEETVNTVCKVVQKIVDTAEFAVGEDTDLAVDLLADSLDYVEIFMALEDEFNIEIMENEPSKFKTVGDLVKLVEGKLAEKVHYGH